MEGQKGGKAFGLGYLCGLVFFTGTLYWFVHVTVLGTILLMLYLAVYFGLFALGFVYFQRKKYIWRLFLIPSLWVGLEFIRDKFLTGFGWVSLGHSQYLVLPLIQVADVTGVWGVSFLLVLVNFFLKELLLDKRKEGQPRTEVAVSTFLVVGILILILVYGIYQLQFPSRKPMAKVNMTIVQTNVVQEIKWDERAWPSILDKVLALTQRAARSQTDLIIWPETSFPGILWESESKKSFEKLKQSITQERIPLLVGAVTKVKENYFNSAILISKEGEIVQQHDKLHLVPFGEYIPLRNIFPFFEDIVPIADFTAGKRLTFFPVFPDRLPEQNYYFGVLICFEDTISEISRLFVNKGAHLLINMTNDAWFLDTKAPYLHLQASIFRTIENRRSLVRSTNTGVSCIIDPWGRITQTLQDPHGKETFIEGWITPSILLNDQKTFYTKFGDIFTYFCFGCILMGVVLAKNRKDPVS